MEYREQVVVFRKDDINHIARIIIYVDIKKGKRPKLISLLFRAGHHGADCAYVLPKSGKILQSTRRRPEPYACRGI